jgi:hypothetical protein
MDEWLGENIPLKCTQILVRMFPAYRKMKTFKLKLKSVYSPAYLVTVDCFSSAQSYAATSAALRSVKRLTPASLRQQDTDATHFYRRLSCVEKIVYMVTAAHRILMHSWASTANGRILR